MAVNVKMGVDVSGFKKGIMDAKTQLKTFDAQLKVAEATMKATGDAEQGLVTKANALNGKLETQRKMLQQYDKALRDMKNAGVEPLSREYQKMATAMLNTKADMLETEAALNKLNGSEQNAAASADKLTQSVGSIGKKMSLDQVISGIDKITGGLENAAKKAGEFARALWGGVTESAERADDIATMASILGMDIESYQRYQKTFDSFADITVREWQTAKNKIQSAVVKPTNEQLDIFAALGVGLRDVNGTISPYYNRYVTGKVREWEDVFWDIGAKLREKVANNQLTQDEADVYAKAIFGKSWSSLNPIFDLGREGFYEKYNNQNVTSEESIKRLAELNDQLVNLKGDFQSLQDEVLAGLAPALTKGAEALDGMLGKLMEYLQKPEGQEMLQKLGTAVSGLFEDLSKIDPQKVVEGFTKVFDNLLKGLNWLVDNRQTVINALETIVRGWAGLKLTGGALEIMKLINGVKEFNGVNTETPTKVTGGNGQELATGAGPGGFWSTVLNKLTLMSIAGAAGAAFNPQNSEAWQKFLRETDGMNSAEKNKYALIHDFGEEAYNLLNGEDIPVEVKPTVPEDAAKSIAEQTGVVTIPAVLSVGGGAGGAGVNYGMLKANGIWSVPYDGYLAKLHKGERVVPAREVNSSRNFSSNLYIESMYMNNGQDAEALASRIAAANKRTMNGYGS